jgi:hypothetical protein
MSEHHSSWGREFGFSGRGDEGIEAAVRAPETKEQLGGKVVVVLDNYDKINLNPRLK